ncbi:hypothetical protein GGR76_002705 [Xanthomonas translucens]|nr:hypothetical protein [Xanthomonas campestris]
MKSDEAARASKLHQAPLAPSSAPTGHLLPRGEGTVKPLSAGRGRWGEGGKRRAARASKLHQAPLAPSSAPMGTLSRGEKQQSSPSPVGRGVGVKAVSGEQHVHPSSTRLRSHPHRPLRGTFSRGEKQQSSPSPPGEGVGGEGGKRRSSTCIQTPPGFARTLIRPSGAPSPEGRRNSQAPLRRGEGVGVKTVSGEAACASKLHQASLAPSSAPTGHLLPRGEGPVKPLSRRERGWGEGTAA